MQFEQIRDDFAFLDDWEDRYRYLIELGNKLEPLPDADHNPENKVSGCASQVWLATRSDDGRLHFLGDSDAHIVRGLVAILLALFNNKSPEEILAIDAPTHFAELGLDEHLSTQRSNGVRAMVRRIRAEAEAATNAAS